MSRLEGKSLQTLGLPWSKQKKHVLNNSNALLAVTLLYKTKQQTQLNLVPHSRKVVCGNRSHVTKT